MPAALLTASTSASTIGRFGLVVMCSAPGDHCWHCARTCIMHLGYNTRVSLVDSTLDLAQKPARPSFRHHSNDNHRQKLTCRQEQRETIRDMITWRKCAPCLGGESGRDEDSLTWPSGTFQASVFHQTHHVFTKMRGQQLVNLHIMHWTP